MSYSNFLSKTIKESGYSLRDIATLCEKQCNVKITASYLSKLQKEGNKNPASESVNIAIAKVCKINPDDLLFEADMERAPESVKKAINELIEFMRNFLLASLNSYTEASQEQKTNIQNAITKITNMSNRELLQAMNEISILDDIDNPLEFNFDLNQDNIQDTIMKFSINIIMEDNSMFPIIQQGAKLELVKLAEYSNGDIVSVKINNEKNIIRTYVENENEIVLIPANRDFETITIPKKDIVINGKIKATTIDL